MKLYDLIAKNTMLTFVDAGTKQEKSLADLHKSLEIEDTSGLVFIYSDNRLDTVETFLNFLDSSYTISLLSAQLNEEFKQQLEALYRPFYLYDLSRTEIEGYQCMQMSGTIRLFQRIERVATLLHPDVKLLLSTSGTTGSPKFVKLSDENLVQNALSILDYMPIRNTDVVPLNVPIIFVYGLSIFTTNCMAAGKIVCTDRDILQKEFWSDLSTYQYSTLGGVPYFYEMLHRIGFFRKDYPSIRYMTQTGGILNNTLTKVIADYSEKHNKLFFIQYGQTEAAGRMAFLPPGDLLKKETSIGLPIKNGRFEIDESTGELLYFGPNVFGGYATQPEDLGTFEHTRQLRTGDVARVDDEGYYYITGRIKRITKLFGTRFNLDEIELILKNNLQGQTFICTSPDDKYLLVMHLNSDLEDLAIHQVLKEKLSLPSSAVRIKCISKVPLTPNGKINYREVVLL